MCRNGDRRRGVGSGPGEVLGGARVIVRGAAEQIEDALDEHRPALLLIAVHRLLLQRLRRALQYLSARLHARRREIGTR